jgi:hypothetical protein
MTTDQTILALGAYHTLLITAAIIYARRAAATARDAAVAALTTGRDAAKAHTALTTQLDRVHRTVDLSFAEAIGITERIKKADKMVIVTGTVPAVAKRAHPAAKTTTKPVIK